MSGKKKYGKFLLVLFLTLLIWVWADLQKTESFAWQNAAVNVAQSASPKLWVTIQNGRSVNLESLELKGTSSRINDLRRSIRAGHKLNFEFDPLQENMDDSGNYTLNLLPFLSKQPQIKERGLKVESCVPRKISVTVQKMTEKILPVVCIDENKNPITASIQPSRVRLSIPEEMEGVAKVQLTTAEIKQARASSVHQIPFFELPDDRIIKSSSPVEISLPEKESLPEHSVTNHRLGFVLSKNLLGKYEVKIENLPDVLGAPIRIRATSAARTAYEDMPYQVVLEVYDSDIKLNGPITRRLKYNFPDKFLINEEIELNQQPVEARFTLVPVKPSD